MHGVFIITSYYIIYIQVNAVYTRARDCNIKMISCRLISRPLLVIHCVIKLQNTIRMYYI